MKKIETREHVQAFLNSFLPKFDIWGIFFIDRKKNDEAIAALGICGYSARISLERNCI